MMTPPQGHWLDELTDSSSQALSEIAERCTFSAGETIVTAGEQSPGIYKLVRGVAEQSKVSKAGEKYILRFIYPGGTFGEVGLGNNNIAIIDIFAKTDVELILYPTTRVLGIAQEHGDVLQGLIGCLSGYVYDAVTLFENSVLLSATDRLIQRLEFILRSIRPNATGEYIIPISQGDLADLVGVSRQVINRDLSELERRGIVGRQYGEIQINPSLLEAELETRQIPTTQNSLFSQKS